jgi:hypothetical protein
MKLPGHRHIIAQLDMAVIDKVLKKEPSKDEISFPELLIILIPVVVIAIFIFIYIRTRPKEQGESTVFKKELKVAVTCSDCGSPLQKNGFVCGHCGSHVISSTTNTEKSPLGWRWCPHQCHGSDRRSPSLSSLISLVLLSPKRSGVGPHRARVLTFRYQELVVLTAPV